MSRRLTESIRSHEHYIETTLPSAKDSGRCPSPLSIVSPLLHTPIPLFLETFSNLAPLPLLRRRPVRTCLASSLVSRCLSSPHHPHLLVWPEDDKHTTKMEEVEVMEVVVTRNQQRTKGNEGTVVTTLVCRSTSRLQVITI